MRLRDLCLHLVQYFRTTGHFGSHYFLLTYCLSSAVLACLWMPVAPILIFAGIVHTYRSGRTRLNIASFGGGKLQTEHTLRHELGAGDWDYNFVMRYLTSDLFWTTPSHRPRARPGDVCGWRREHHSDPQPALRHWVQRKSHRLIHHRLQRGAHWERQDMWVTSHLPLPLTTHSTHAQFRFHPKSQSKAPAPHVREICSQWWWTWRDSFQVNILIFTASELHWVNLRYFYI